MTFNDFLQQRLQYVPYDFPKNQFGFKATHGSDMSAHMPLLMFLAKECNHITEFGTRECYSTSAFIASCKGIVVSYDININNDIIILQNLELPCQWKFYQQSTIDPNLQIEQTDILLIDTDHTYVQVKEELKLHASRINKYIIFHDTYSFPEIVPAIIEFLNTNINWKIVYNVQFNHGLIIIEKLK